MIVRTVALAEAPPILDHDPGLAWISEDQILIGFGESLRVSAGFGPDRFERAERAFARFIEESDIEDAVDVPGTGPVAFASLTFDERSPGSVLIVPQVVIGRSGDSWFATTFNKSDVTPYLAPTSTPAQTSDRPRFAGASIPDVAWVEAVAEAISRITAGEAEKVVLARDFALWSRTQFDTRRLMDRLSTRFPGCFTFAVDGLIGASPELLIRVDGLRIESVALAGTAGRADDPSEDAQLGEQLLHSIKDRNEHQMAANSVERVLSSVTNQLTSDPTPVIRRLDNVQHLATRFEGTLDSHQSALHLAGMLHPTAAVGGQPTATAVEMIRELEHMDRGRYAGPVGWVDHRRRGEFAIALRCAEISGARARLFAGAGIMADSLPERELEETRLKLSAMMTALE